MTVQVALSLAHRRHSEDFRLSPNPEEPSSASPLFSSCNWAVLWVPMSLGVAAVSLYSTVMLSPHSPCLGTAALAGPLAAWEISLLRREAVVPECPFCVPREVLTRLMWHSAVRDSHVACKDASAVVPCLRSPGNAAYRLKPPARHLEQPSRWARLLSRRRNIFMEVGR